MANDIAIYVDNDVAVMVPVSLRAHMYFTETLNMPEDCDGLDVTDIGAEQMLPHLPRHYIFTSTKKEPKKTAKCLLP